MRLAPFLAASVVAIGLTAAASAPQAATFAPAPLKGIEANQSLAAPVAWRRYCWRWRNICSRRWGWGGPRFRRCMWRHGC
ncbi:hypothetical protein [Hyphomicrobium sp. MC1]|uniref:hypothetical protein n=1 Tax=Hyphomicrobium sp. (strain MC1) TaxID=717785 RepID=UPI000213F8FF|nr:hypothetical protein [Hyphomicrobium sp. MC1]CCB63601.1 Cellulase [Hyphomicrobium sp. MC1]